MFAIHESNNREMRLNVTINCSGKKKFRVWVQEVARNNSKYADREIVVDGSRMIYFSLPVTPKRILIGCFNAVDTRDESFEMKVEEVPLRKFNIWLDEGTKEFMQLDISFSQKCGFEKPKQNGTIYQSPDARFNIKYFPVIRDFMSKAPLSTPARIGHSTGLIEASAYRFVPYTIPMRFIIVLHEYCHKWKNPKIGLQIGHETGADINALYLYLGSGFSKIDAICVFANVFLKAQTDENIARMRKINDYIKRFENQEYAQLM